MLKNVLLVDDDKEMLLAMQEGFKEYQESFSVLLAEDGLKALESLKTNVISLVVTDLKMPRMDGFELLAYIMAHYPDIPVIMITGYSTPEMEQLARQGGAISYISKPFLIENLALQIITTLRKESEGGTLHNVNSGIFLQLVEMEQKTCTIRLEDKSSGQKGVLFFREGDLLDARVNNFQGEAAAHRIFSWEDVNLSIQDGCALNENKILKDLQPLILEAMRQKDESVPEIAPIAVMKEIEPLKQDSSDLIKDIKDKIENGVGERCGLEDIYQDNSWDRRLSELSKVGEFFNMGKLMLGYIDKGDANDYILLPNEKTTVIVVDPKCPRDKIIQVLND
ncbi:MAG: response regulator [Desulfobacterales bacterium]|nr:MAG: response regulator [Desulfobacterales bacterium]